MKFINKNMLESVESMSRKMSKLGMGDFESNRKKILSDMIKSKLESQKIQAEKELKELLGED